MGENQADRECVLITAKGRNIVNKKNSTQEKNIAEKGMFFGGRFYHITEERDYLEKRNWEREKYLFVW